MKVILDFSHENPNVNWDTVATIPALEGVVLKVSEGVTLQDPMFQVRMKAASVHELEVKGLYHFYHPADDPNQQADNYIKTRESVMTAKAIPAVIDLEWCEDAKEWSEVPEERRYADLKTFISRMEAEDYPVMIYSSHSFMNQYLPHADFLAAYGLWVAWYEAAPPLLPVPWKTWIWWQYTGTGNVPGVLGDVDISYVNDGGSLLSAD